jgi:hypothetical protein
MKAYTSYKMNDLLLGVGTVHRMHADTSKCEAAEIL